MKLLVVIACAAGVCSRPLCSYRHIGSLSFHPPAAHQVFDPRGLCKEDYIEELQKEWAAEEERRKVQRQATGRIEFTKSASQPNLAPNPLLPGLNPAAALAAAQLKAAQLAAGMGAAPAAGGQGGVGAASGAGKGGSKWDTLRR